ncbi:alpha-mannosidase [Sulfodiicoccus acidiphilus]|uniref:Alpha-mannosidase n=1 Tax=Sulfodiicoccus acidiphilus TaxID=1670455 RepID=A0A348B520_9CREN|nr:alpha-mannosidase [Sulfodiicoccus acidiphilus]BBD73272.1 alpha-mannosidase [Sulfodiicoccus acidiphilus]GGT89459.1 alpha-mannosidase [Sulfodiicoccus acidiphilus]
MRTHQELESRLNYVLASSFKRPTFLKWEEAKGNVGKVNVDSTGGNFRLMVVDSAGSALVKLDGRPHFEIDRYHISVPVPVGRHEVSVEFSNLMDFGEKVEVNLGTPVAVERDFSALRLWAYGSSILDAVRSLKDPELEEDMLSLLSKALAKAPFRTVSRDQLILAVKAAGLPRWVERFPASIEKDLEPIYAEEEDGSRFEKALLYLKEGLGELRRKYGKRGLLIAVGHAHIDTAWLWNFDETRRKVHRTFSTVLTLMDRYDFHHVQSASIYYEWLKEDHPELFQRIKEKVKEGKWELAASYVETDTNMVTGESLARQLLYSQRFFLREFGRLAEVLWLPDTFGFASTVPEVARLGGAKAFATHKVFWNDTNTFPYNVFHWVAPDGSKIPAVAFGHGKGGYNSDFSASSVVEQWRGWKEKDQPMLYAYGYGDGGGGPTEEMLLRAEAIEELPVLPKVSLGGVSTELSKISPVDQWRGELYVETHRGVFTSHSAMKYLNRRAELALREAEIWSSIAGTYARERFQRLWKVVLKDQFHDVLPGSAIRDVYKVAYRELEEVINEAESLTGEALSKLLGSGDQLVACNSLQWSRTDYVKVNAELEGGQEVEGGTLVRTTVPPMGCSKLSPSQPTTPVRVEEGDDWIVLDNGLLRVTLNQSGEVESVVDLREGRQVIKGGGNRIVVYENVPGPNDAWDVEASYELASTHIKASHVEVTARGPLMGEVTTIRKFGRNEIEQKVRLLADSDRLDFFTVVRMRDRELMVKAWFDFDVNAENYVVDAPFGVTERPTHRNTSWEAARFEAPMQKFVDLSEGDYGVSLLNDGKYGVAVKGSSVGITLTRTPIFPDPATDLEETKFTYSLLPHRGTWRDGLPVRRAWELNVPLRVVRASSDLPSQLSVEGDLVLEAVKIGEDDDSVVLRLFEFQNRRGNCVLRFNRPVSAAEATDLLELNGVQKKLRVEGNSVSLDYGNREIVTLKVRLG